MTAKKYPTTLADLKNGISIPGEDKECTDETSHKLVIQKPEWYDEDRFKRGCTFFDSNRSAILFSYLCALMVGFTVEELTAALVYTGESVGPSKSRKRYLRTALCLIQWHDGGDVFDPGSVAGRSLLHVRKWHDSVRNSMTNSVKEEKMEQTAQVEPLMNQYNMALVQSGFIGPIVMHPKELGINARQEDIDDYVYFWRVIGWCLGIRDDYNMCGGGGNCAKTIAKQVEQQIIVPGLLSPSPTFKLLCTDFVDGMQSMVPGLSEAAFHRFLFPSMGLPKPKVEGFKQWLFYYRIVLVCWLNFYCPPFRWLLNFLSKNIHRYMMSAPDNQLSGPKYRKST